MCKYVENINDKSIKKSSGDIVKDRDYWLWFTNVRGMTRKDMAKIIRFGYNPKSLFYASQSELEKNLFSICKLNITINDLIKSRSLKAIEKYKKSLKDKNIDYLTIDDDDYPDRLNCLHDKAYVLYYMGNLKKHELNISIVGARRCTPYSRNVAFQISKDLASTGVNIVSGLAYGIDSSSHLGALEVGGFTTAVVGCGFNYCYPPSNKDLMDKIVRTGIVFSEYAPHIRPTKYTFPLRNRIISGLSDGILLVEAKKKSGSLITINHGLEVGKDIFAVPLDILGKSNEGGNQVIRDGGKIVFNYEDILEEYPLFWQNNKSDNQSANDEQKVLSLEDDEKKVYEFIGYDAIDLEDIIYKSNISIEQLQYILIKLEMKGAIMALSNKRYVRNV